MNLFYCQDSDLKSVVLPDEEAHHIVHVLRLSMGAEIELTNGVGKRMIARLVEVSKKQVIAEVISEKMESPRKHSLHIAIAPTKNIDRFEWFLEKSTEIGIEQITPLLCSRSERKEIKPDRLNKLIVSAAKQSQHYYFPILHPIQAFSKFISHENHGNRWIAHCLDENKSTLKSMADFPADTTILIGPEGDFTETEIKAATHSGFKPLSLGASRLRTETAAVVACAGFAIMNDL